MVESPRWRPPQHPPRPHAAHPVPQPLPRPGSTMLAVLAAIDYDPTAENEQSFSLDHRFPVSTHPHVAENAGNFEASHLDRNKRRGNRDAPLTLGVISRPS